MSEQGKQPLEYGLDPAGPRRRRVVRFAVIAAAIALLLAAIPYAVRLVQRAQYARVWYRLAEHRWPDEEPVYSSHPEDVARLTNDPRYTAIRLESGTHIVRKVPDEWRRVFDGGLPHRAPVFIGERFAGGRRLLVGARVENSWTPLGATVVSGPWDDRGSTGTGAMASGVYFLTSMNSGMRIYAGRPDPKDKTAFLFDFEHHGRRGTVRGQVATDGSITFNVTPPPATGPAAINP
jgi:hypothetical protein